MRGIHWVQLDEVRPAVVLTRPEATSFLSGITVAPITSTIRGVAVEVPVGRDHGLEHDSVINCDNVTTVPKGLIGERIGLLGIAEEAALLSALQAAYGLLPLR